VRIACRHSSAIADASLQQEVACGEGSEKENQPQVVAGKAWCERGESPPHGFPRQILSLNPATDSKADHQVTSADSGKVLQNPQPRRNKTKHKGKE